MAVTPGTFGFDKWPSATREQIADTPLRVAPRKVQVAVREPERRAARTATATLRVSSNVVAAPRVRLVALAPASPHRLAATPTPAPVHQHSGGPGTPTQPVSTPAPQAPAATAPAATAPAAPAPATSVPVQVATAGTQSALRDEPQDTTDPAPASDHHGSPARGPIAAVTHALPAPVGNIVGDSGRSHDDGERGHDGEHGHGRDTSSGHHGD